jgi:hypothetical protein
MPGTANAFIKGGFGCLLVFAILAGTAVALGGWARIDPCGAVCLFVFGGSVGAVINAVYQRGRRDALAESRPELEPIATPAEFDPHPDWVMPAWMLLLIVAFAVLFAGCLFLATVSSVPSNDVR